MGLLIFYHSFLNKAQMPCFTVGIPRQLLLHRLKRLLLVSYLRTSLCSRLGLGVLRRPTAYVHVYVRGNDGYYLYSCRMGEALRNPSMSSLIMMGCPHPTGSGSDLDSNIRPALFLALYNLIYCRRNNIYLR